MCVYTHTHTHKWTSRVVLVVKNLLPNAEDIKDAGSIPGLRRSPGGEHGNHASILAQRIPWTEKPGGLVHKVAKGQT